MQFVVVAIAAAVVWRVNVFNVYCIKYTIGVLYMCTQMQKHVDKALVCVCIEYEIPVY